MMHLRFFLAATAVAIGLGVSACGSSGSLATTAEAEAVPADYPGNNNTVPATPAAGKSRAGTAYDVYIQGPGTGDKIAFTVFEPATLEGGKTYPLVLYGAGFGNPRDTASSNADVKYLTDAGYGAISFDYRGHGESNGTIRVMDPDYEGKDLLAVLDWAEAKLDWLEYRPSGDDPHNLVLGSTGGSYGGMYQYMLHNIDPKHRLDAMVPEVAPNNLDQALFPNGVPKTIWDVFLFTAAQTAGVQGGFSAAHLDPYLISGFIDSLAADKAVNGLDDFLYYHSNQYFCADRQVATNGGPGTAPELPPRLGPPVNAMLFQGMRDTLFDFSQAYANYQCLRREGGDVRLLSYQAGHNQFQVAPDPGQIYQPLLEAFDKTCGSLDVYTATLAFFKQYLQGVPGAANAVPTRPCLSIEKGDWVLVNQIMTQQGGGETEVDIPATNVIAGLTGADLAPVAVDLGIVGAKDTSVVGGIPHLQLTVQAAPGSIGEPTLFVGLGQTHNGVPGVWDLIDNQVLPLRGTGTFDVDLVGVAARLAAGDQLALLIYGLHSQFIATGSINTASPAVVPVTVSGKVWVPLLPAGSYVAAP
jgi:ABC-2 type transport system ATP-binding protein